MESKNSTVSKIKVKISKPSNMANKTPNTTNEIIVPVPTVAAAAVNPTSAAGATIADEPETCSICIESFTAKLRRSLKCPYCEEKICSQCLEKYLLNTIEDPHCVNCRRGWSQSLLQSFCTKTFLTKTYADYRSNILLNRSKSYLPRYQERAERVRSAQNYRQRNTEYQERLVELSKKQDELNKERDKILMNMRRNDMISYEIENGRRDLEGNRLERIPGGAEEEQETQERKKFIRRCPYEGCNGFLSSAWKCGLCFNWTCPDCFVVKGLNKDVEHTCRPEDKSTADEIRKRTKPCPNCGELIEKAEGCDQMFCTSCHSPFSWSRGEVIKTGVIHNPHYFEWLQRNGGAPGGRHHMDIPCGGLPGYHAISLSLRANGRGFELSYPDRKSEVTPLINYLTNAYRTCGHIIDVERNRWTAHTRPETDETATMCVDFLLGNLKEDGWRQRLKSNERLRIKSKEIREILDAFNNAAIDIWRDIDGQIRENKLNKDNFIQKTQEWKVLLEQLRNFMNEPLWEISRIYNCQVPQISQDFRFQVKSVAKDRKEKRAEAAALAEAEKGLLDAATAADADADSDNIN